MRIVILVSLLFIQFTGSFAQYPCGTIVSDAQKILENSIPKVQNDTMQNIKKIDKNLSLVVVVIHENNGSAGIAENEIMNALHFANEVFSAAGIQVNICERITLKNYQYSVLKQKENEGLLVNMYPRPGRITVFLGSTILDKMEREVCGYTYMPGDQKDVIFLSKTCLKHDPGLLAHQLGHQLNLYETHETAFGKENSNKTNCASAGDMCCDTPADPNLNQYVNSSCQYNAEVKDTNDEFYTPSVLNVMSFSNGRCRCNLTTEQYNRMIFSLMNFKSYLW